MAWLNFTFMTQCLPAGIFTIAGAYQMAVWALGKHKNYKNEFKVLHFKLLKVNNLNFSFFRNIPENVKQYFLLFSKDHILFHVFGFVCIVNKYKLYNFKLIRVKKNSKT